MKMRRMIKRTMKMGMRRMKKMKRTMQMRMRRMVRESHCENETVLI